MAGQIYTAPSTTLTWKDFRTRLERHIYGTKSNMYDLCQNIIATSGSKATESTEGYDLLSPTVDYDVTIIETPLEEGKPKEVTCFERRDEPLYRVGTNTFDGDGFPVTIEVGKVLLERELIEDWKFWMNGMNYNYFTVEPVEADDSPEYRYDVMLTLDIFINRVLPETVFKLHVGDGVTHGDTEWHYRMLQHL